MYFNTLDYVFFLWAVYVLWWTFEGRRSIRHSIVLIASYLFYAQSDWRFCSLLFVSTIVDHFCGKSIQAAKERDDARRAKLYLIVSLVSNLGMLGFFKYFDFFVDSFEALFAQLGQDLNLWHLSAARGGPLEFLVPAGISFYTFQTLSYTIDIYKGRIKPCESHLDFAVYVSFFPQLVAGPIVRARDFLPQMKKKTKLTRDRVSYGVFLILKGLVKKVVIADYVAIFIVDPVYAGTDGLAAAGSLAVFLATWGFMLQLYMDFAGYSDIAIGSAHLLGFRLRKNFDAPLKSRSLEEFWTRWHISMSYWFYDYVFGSLGANKKGLARTCVNLFLTHLLSGIWHGAGWNFVLWGVWFGAWMVIVRIARHFLPGGRLPANALFGGLGWLFTITICFWSAPLFRCKSVEEIATVIETMFSFGAGTTGIVDTLPWQFWTIFVIGWLLSFRPDSWPKRAENAFKKTPLVLQGVIVAVAIFVLFGAKPQGVPFLYFNF